MQCHLPLVLKPSDPSCPEVREGCMKSVPSTAYCIFHAHAFIQAEIH